MATPGQTSPAGSFLPRRTAPPSTGDQFLTLLSQGNQLGSDAIIASFSTAVPLTIVIGILFCFLRPYNNVVYAPRAKHADSKHAPPPISKGLLAWIPALITVKEQDLVEKVGLDAAVFLRVCRMLRNMFVVLSVLGCGILIPTAIVATNRSGFGKKAKPFDRITPAYLLDISLLWPYVTAAYLFTLTVGFFLYINYRAIHRLRRNYFDSAEYQRSLHARTLLVVDLPKEIRSDEGIVRLTEELRATQSIPRAAVARNVRDLPELVGEHEEAVRRLEKILAKYLKNPERLPVNRPLCSPSRKDRSQRGGKVDAIEYLTGRIRSLEIEIKQVRDSVDRRNALSYGFASYEHITDAHTAAFVARKGGPHGTLLRLAPRPNDLVWKNLRMSKKDRKWRNFINNLWIALLTAVWVAPNIMMSVFLSNLSNLGRLWPAFQQNLQRYPKTWALVQAVAAPAITTLFYFFLPAIFRKLCIKAGDVTKTSRERHVMHKLYSFFVFNQLVVFSLFASVFGYIVTIIRDSSTEGFVKAFMKQNGFVICWQSLIGVGPYWMSWLLQRQLGAAIDLSQLFSLSWGSFSRRFLSPTPRELIELTAPQPFDYASYYNYFLFYSTVALCFAPIQPLVLPVVAIYFALDCFLKKYLLLYIFITKYESGGMFWRTIFNRALFMLILSYVVLILQLVATLNTFAALRSHYGVLVAMVPLPILVMVFKWYCARTFDQSIHFYSTGKALLDAEFSVGTENKRRTGDKVGVRFGNPVLYKPLMTPMVAAKSQHLLKQIYTGRLDADHQNLTGFSDVYMDAMDNNQPGKTAASAPAPFEFVRDHEMNFEHFKNRPEFRDQAGGDGRLFGRDQDIMRPGTPGSMSMLTRTATNESLDGRQQSGAGVPSGYHSRDMSGDSDKTRVGDGVEYPRGYHQMPSNLREQSPVGSDRSYDGQTRQYGVQPKNDTRSREALVGQAAHMGVSTPAPFNPYAPAPGGYAQIGTTPFDATPAGTPGGGEDTSYDYFRRGRQRY